MQTGTQQPKTIYTIGHSNHTLDAFLSLLKPHNIEVLIDTRSAPFSRYSPQFNLNEIKREVEAVGIKYGFYGKELGGRPQDEEYYDQEGHVLYSALAKSWLFNEGIERLTQGLEKYTVAIFCSEEDPNICHRRLLISRVLHNDGVLIKHIRGNGCIQTEEDLLQEERKKTAFTQMELFDDALSREVAWKSIQSVLPKVRRHISSGD